MSQKNKLASIIILSYNSSEDLCEFIPSLECQTYQNYEIIVVDNASSDDTVNFVRTKYPEIKLIETGANLGYPGGNNIGFEHAKGEYIVVVNPDTVADPKWLEELIKPLEEDPTISVTTSKILIYYQKERINTCGNSTHYTGLDFCKGLNRLSDMYAKKEMVGAISGCSFAIRREMLEYIDGFDSDFFLYLEDADLSWRVRFAGGNILYVPTSIIYHKFKLSIAPWKEFYLERNRYLILLKNFEAKTLFLLLPALFVTEIVTMGHAVLNGPEYIMNKLKAYRWLIGNWNSVVLKKRRETLSKKKITDREFFDRIEWRIPFEQVIENRMLCVVADTIFNSFYNVYFKFIKKLI